MVKKLNGYLWKVLYVAAGALIAFGVYSATVNSNTERIEKVEIKAEKTENELIEVKTEIRTDIKNIREGIGRIEKRLE